MDRLHAVQSSISRQRREGRSRLPAASFKDIPPCWIKTGERVKCLAHNNTEFTILSGKTNRSSRACGYHSDVCDLVEIGPYYKCSVGNNIHICCTSQCRVLQSDGLTTVCSVTGFIVPTDVLVHHVEYDEHGRSTNSRVVKAIPDQTTIKMSLAMRTYIAMVRIWTASKNRDKQSLYYTQWFENSKFLSDLVYAAADSYRSMNLQRRRVNSKVYRACRSYNTSIRFRLFSVSYLILYLRSMGDHVLCSDTNLTCIQILKYITEFILKARIDTTIFDHTYRPHLSDKSIHQLTSTSQGKVYFNPLRTKSIFKTQNEILGLHHSHKWSHNLQSVPL